MHDDDIVQIYMAAQPLQAHFLSNLLADAGIEARVVGEPLNSVDPPVNLQSGALWVRRQDAETARQLLVDWEQSRAHPVSGVAADTSWKCSACGEMVDGDFELCWNCQHVRE